MAENGGPARFRSLTLGIQTCDQGKQCACLHTYVSSSELLDSINDELLQLPDLDSRINYAISAYWRVMGHMGWGVHGPYIWVIDWHGLCDNPSIDPPGWQMNLADEVRRRYEAEAGEVYAPPAWGQSFASALDDTIGRSYQLPHGPIPIVLDGTPGEGLQAVTLQA